MRSFIKKKLNSLLMERKGKRIAAGVLVKCTDTDKVLLLLRNDVSFIPNTWSLVSGGVDEGENILEGLKREVGEELSIDPNIIDYKYIKHEYIEEKKLDFYYYEGFTKSEFIPTLCDENLDWGWYTKDELPSPLYPGVDKKIEVI